MIARRVLYLSAQLLSEVSFKPVATGEGDLQTVMTVLIPSPVTRLSPLVSCPEVLTRMSPLPLKAPLNFRFNASISSLEKNRMDSYKQIIGMI